ncbi:uncharacterized protein LOC115013169 isoform X2 [Cottoperca gobio]|uniref:Uncharacterized protein LOC115013169 isoform X2 n=1 Tax=Cottoperca gobio TaxID=56716 RepID=A0A6J2QBM8_COTGO|nr:uncharacterized protein LOC115013169 isoform X2 [Cottoperca gobio]
MEEYLRRVQSRLGGDALEDPIHAVLGGPEPDVDTVAATLCIALHLSQKETGAVCVPVLWRRRCDAVLPEETVRYLQRVKICESSLLWREDVDLMKLHHTGKLSLTLLRDGLLDSSEYQTLESSILRVVHHDGQQDAGDDRASSVVTRVAGEILQEAAEHVGAALGETLGEALRLQSEALWIKHGRRSAQLEELMRSLEQWSDVTAGQHDEAKLQDLEHLLTQELKEFSDGEMTIALTSVTTYQEDWHSYVEGLKSFSHRHGYDGLVVLLSINDTVHHPRQQVAVYSNSTDLLNQICCELEESSSWSLSGELEASESLQIYHIPINTCLTSGTPPLLVEEIKGILKDFVDRRSSVLACHPSSRTSSTEGVAGSVEFSQGSSGINDMDGSDIERAEGGSGDVVPIARVMADGGEEDTGGVGASAGGELVSPDSGMTTIRSSRSSKESSVFLSDESPVGEVIAGGGPTAGPGGLFLRNPSPLGVSSLSPPVPPERRKNRSGRNKSETFDLFSFDPLHSSDQSIPTRLELANSGVKGDEVEARAGSSSLSELEELSLLDFSASLGGLDSRNSSVDHHGQSYGNDMMDTVVPPTPVNSVVGSRPPSSCGVRFFPEDVVERINGLQHKDSVSSSLSETWDELGFETQGAMSSSDNNAWNRTKESESPPNIVEEVRGKETVDDMNEQKSTEEILKSENTHQRGKSLEPQLSLITEQTESYNTWNPDSVCKDNWNPISLACLQLTPPEEEVIGKCSAGIIGVKEKTSSLSRKKAILNTLTPDRSKEDDEGVQGKKGDRQIELLDFWTYSAQKGFLKSDSVTITSYPESLDLWNMTIREDSLSPLTTPDNLSGNSGSFCELNPNVEPAASVESPQGLSDGGMVMWNTTIQEDSSSTITSPEGPENGKDLSHMGSLDTSNSLETQVEEETIEEERGINEVLTPTPEEVGWRGYEHNVKIVIEAAEGRTQGEETGDDDIQSFQSLASEHSEEESSPYQGTDMWDLSVPGMVTSTSEYDNVGASTWSLTSSPETYVSHVVDMIQLEEQSSPFVAVTKPIQIDERHKQHQQVDTLDGRVVVSDKDQPTNQVFLFEGTSELGHMISSGVSSIESMYDKKRGEGSEEVDWIVQHSDHSPFVLVDSSTVTQTTSANHYSSPGEAADTQIQADQSLSPSLIEWDNPVSKEHVLLFPIDQNEDGPATGCQGGPDNESMGNVVGKTTETLSLSSSSGGDRDTLKHSPDSLHPGSRDELRSNSDGDSSSGLEMDYIIVSGTVKEAEREWHDRPKQGCRQSKGTRKSMETFSMLSYAATVLQAQAQANREHQENNEQSKQNQMIRGTERKLTEQSQAVSCTQYQASLDNATGHHIVPEIISPSQSKTNSEAFHQSDSRLTGCNQTQVEEGNYDDKSSIVARSVSPSLRYPSDHFLKTREEVYVHSQISMEDSDEGGQSPSAPPPCPTSLGGFQVWGGQLARQEAPQTTCEPQSPLLTNSSVSHTSSLIGTPLSEPGISTDRGLGLPFSGDLMEEDNDEEEQQEITDVECTALPKLTTEVHSVREERQQLGSSDLLSFTEELVAGSSFQQTGLQRLEPKRDRFLQNTVEYYNGQPIRTDDCDKWLTERRIGDHESSQDSYSPVLRHSQQGDSEAGIMLKMASSEEAAEEMDNSEDPPSSADLSGGSNQRRKLAAPPMNVSLDRSEGSLNSEDALDTEDEALDTGDDLDVNIDELDTPDEADLLELNRNGDSEESNMGAGAASSGAIAGHRAAEESRENRLWRSVVIGDQEHRIDMKCIEPYKRVISHGGYYAEQNAIIVFAACFLPDSDCDNYNYVMENLFLYVISTLELMVAEDYIIVYLNGATPRRRMPGFTWMKKCYQMIDRRLKKNLKMFIIVHPSWFIRTLLGITRPFISSKFSSKIKYVNSLQELGEIIPMEYVHIPPSIVKYDEEKGIHKFACMRADRKGNSFV